MEEYFNQSDCSSFCPSHHRLLLLLAASVIGKQLYTRIVAGSVWVFWACTSQFLEDVGEMP